MNENQWLVERFDEHRAHLRRVAYRMLGSAAAADDAVQDAWLRLSRSHGRDIENLRGWLTAVVARLCLDGLRARKTRAEQDRQLASPAPIEASEQSEDPERDLLMADSVGVALLVVLETLSPAERVAFVLHDMFDVAFEDIGPIVGRSATAARQLASRARRRVRGADAVSAPDRERQHEIVRAFLAASRSGDFEALLAVLDPEVALHADETAAGMGAPAEVRGADAVAKLFMGRAAAARPALIDGIPGAVWAPGGKPRVAVGISARDGAIVEIRLVADPADLSKLELVLLEA